MPTVHTGEAQQEQQQSASVQVRLQKQLRAQATAAALLGTCVYVLCTLAHACSMFCIGLLFGPHTVGLRGITFHTQSLRTTGRDVLPSTALLDTACGKCYTQLREVHI